MKDFFFFFLCVQITNSCKSVYRSQIPVNPSFYLSFKNTKNLFIHIALIPIGDLLEISQHFKKCPLHSPVAKGHRLVVIATRAMMRDERNHSVIVDYLAPA